MNRSHSTVPCLRPRPTRQGWAGRFLAGACALALWGLTYPSAHAVPLFLSGDGCAVGCPLTDAANKLTVPNADLIKLQNPDSEAAGGARDALNSAKAAFEAAGRTVVTGALNDSVQDYIDMIMDRSDALGRAISVVLIGHGAPGLIDLGDDDLDDTTKPTFAQALLGKIDMITLFSCNTGAGDIGRSFGNMLASNLGRVPVMAYDSCIAIENDMFFAIGGDAAKLTFVPEPTTLVLIGMSLAGLSLRRRHYDRMVHR